MSAESLKAPKKQMSQREADRIEQDLQRVVNSLSLGLELVDSNNEAFERFEAIFDQANTLDSIIHSISEMAEILSEKLTAFFGNSTKAPSEVKKGSKKAANKSEDFGAANYENLEKVLQKYEGEIREHIRIEQQLKIYSESLEERIEKLEVGDHEQLARIDSLEQERVRLHRELRELRSTRGENAVLRKGDSGLFMRPRETNTSSGLHAKTGSMDQLATQHVARTLKELKTDERQLTNSAFRRSEKDRGSRSTLHSSKMLASFKQTYGDILNTQTRGAQKSVNKRVASRALEVIIESSRKNKGKHKASAAQEKPHSQKRLKLSGSFLI